MIACVRLLRPVQYTVAPASPSARAMPRPAPRVAPATTATWPASLRGISRRDFGELVRALVRRRVLMEADREFYWAVRSAEYSSDSVTGASTTGRPLLAARSRDENIAPRAARAGANARKPVAFTMSS